MTTGASRAAAEISETERAASIVRAVDPDSALGMFNRAGILSPADLHVASCLGRLGGEPEEVVTLGAAFAVRAPRVGHVYVDLARIRDTASAGDDDADALDALPWPDPDTWIETMAECSLVASHGIDPNDTRPLVLEGSALYLNRLWCDEVAVAEALFERVSATSAAGEIAGESLHHLFPDAESADQRRAAATALACPLAVVVGGPGTGKTTTVARLLSALFEEADRRGARLPLVGLAAPTGKAAARLTEAVQEAAQGLAPLTRDRLAGLEASTVHRLLGSRPNVATRFVHAAGNPLPFDVVVVDETSMLPLWLMARLLDAVRPDARLVLLGDPDQLASVEAGVVLADIVGPDRSWSAPVAPASVSTASSPAIERCVVALRTNYRFSGALAELADAVRAGEIDRALGVLGSGDPAVEWVAGQAGGDPGADRFLEELSVEHGRSLSDAAWVEGAEGALRQVEGFRMLCAHRRGPAGALRWNDRIERLMETDRAAHWGFYVGRPVIVTANDYGLRLFNGDVGVVVPKGDDGVEVAFRRGAQTTAVSPSWLPPSAGVYAMTIHKAQGSEFDEVAVVLPDPSSRILTRELLYTAITRARQRVRIVGTEDALRAGIERRVARASGLMRRLWGDAPVTKEAVGDPR
ncbi:MAG TPA: exodeoxyribonuclease V subunit alpha [Acidimicrobiales bacterium]|nr:exodeoxyribonuclease V subunit alpha [Acidimicrobiales bacterium]